MTDTAKGQPPATRKMALDNAIRRRGRELGMPGPEVNKVVKAARERADREWGD